MSELSAPDFPSVEELGHWLPQYEIEEQEWAGRDGVRYYARQPTLDRRVVIEMMPEPPENEANAVMEHLRRRARLAHPTITAVFDFGRTPSGLFYLVMEHVEGVSLETIIEQRQLKPKTAFPLAIQICEALQIVHDQPMAHGSLSPLTVMVTHEGQAKLTGIGRVISESGDLSWLEPGSARLQTDIHDLGLTLHWMFAKCAPGADGRLSRDLPPAFATVLRRCLEPNSSRLFTRPIDVSMALKEALRGEQEKSESTTRSKMVIAPGSKPQQPVTTPPPKIAPGSLQPVVRHHQPSFLQRMDAFVWKAFTTGLHLLISLVTICGVIALILFKDKIVFEDDTSLPVATVEQIEAEEKPIPAAVMGALPPMEALPVPIIQIKPITLPAPKPEVAPLDLLADLNAQYVAAVQTAANYALEKVKLDDLPHLQRELQLLQRGGDIPTVDEPNLPASLKALRQRYREARANIGR